MYFLGIGVAVILALFAPNIAKIFDSNPTVTEVAANYLRIVPISYGFAGIIFVVASAFNALGKPIPSMIINFARMILLYVPLAYIGSQMWGILGIFGATLTANVLVGIISYIWIQKETTQLQKSPSLN